MRNLTKSNTMAICELYPIMIVCSLRNNELPTKRVLFYCDNQPAVHIINKGGSKIPIIMALVRKKKHGCPLLIILVSMLNKTTLWVQFLVFR